MPIPHRQRLEPSDGPETSPELPMSAARRAPVAKFTDRPQSAFCKSNGGKARSIRSLTGRGRETVENRHPHSNRPRRAGTGHTELLGNRLEAIEAPYRQRARYFLSFGMCFTQLGTLFGVKTRYCASRPQPYLARHGECLQPRGIVVR